MGAAVCTQEELSRQVESGHVHSMVPRLRAVRCFSISCPTIASTVSVVCGGESHSGFTRVTEIQRNETYGNLQLAV